MIGRFEKLSNLFIRFFNGNGLNIFVEWFLFCFYNLFMVKIICKFYIIINIFNKIIKIKFMIYRFDINMLFIFLFF